MFLSDFSVKRPVTTAMIIGAIVVFGIYSYPRVGVDQFPKVDIPFASVVTVYPGADPETVENEVSEKIEEAVSTISGLRSLRSISVENLSQVMIEFELEVDTNEAVQDVRDKVSRIIPQLPSEVESPKIEKFDLGAIPILTIALSGPGTIDQVTMFARKRIKEHIESTFGVGSVEIVGGQEREIKVWVDPGKLDAMGLAVTDVVQALEASNLKYPGGRLTSEGTEFSVKVDGELKDVEAVRNLKIAAVEGHGVRIRDVARVEDGLEEKRSVARLDGVSAVTLTVQKQSGANTVAVGTAVKVKLEELKKGFPAGWKVLVVRDNTVTIKASIESVQFDILFGGILAIIIVFFFLKNVRSTIVAALAIPTSIIGTISFIDAMGFTFNTLSLLAISLSIGILIDDAIVVLENIYRHMEEGKSPYQAAVEGAREIGFAVVATTLSLVCVFVPVAFMQGFIGMFFYEFGLTVAFAVMLSLFVSFTLTPMLCSVYLKVSEDNWFFSKVERFLNWLDIGYRSIIAWALKHRLATVIIALISFIAVIPIAASLGAEMMPVDDMGEFNVTVRMPTGTALSETEKVARKISDQVRDNDYVISTITSIGADAQKKQNLAKIYVKLVSKKDRDLTLLEFMKQTREAFADVKEAAVAVEILDMVGGDTGFRTAPIQFSVRGGDLKELDKLTRKIISELSEIPGFVDLDTSFEGGKPEVTVRVDRDRAANLGVTTAQIGQTVRALVGGVEASKYREGGEDYTIRVRLEEANRRRADQLADLEVRSNDSGELIPLANLTRVEVGSGPTQIDRNARQREITVFSNLESTLPLAEAVEKLQAVAANILPPDVVTSFEGDVRMMEESFASMGTALLLAIILVYMVLASQFESFVHPFTIMMSLPLSVVGALGALLIADQTISIMSLIGIIMLMGVVTKNAILLIDYTNTLRRRDGMERNAALLKAGPTRLRPILMTAMATIFGMLPVALSQGLGSEGRSPMATCVIGGLAVSTLLTLVVVPVVYTLMDDLTNLVTRKGRVKETG
ncbi:MAG: efflux RND transporter permease subunit [Proteobacteria bacterium]|nr:efflux RND transporter permease subunit [Pseudomonadota bacterium]